MKIIKKISCFAFLIILFVLVNTGVRAHGNESSFEKMVGSYFVDIGYPDEAIAGSALQFDFELYENNASTSTKKKVSFSDIWVRIEKENKTLLATGIHRPHLGKTGLLYTPQEEGSYTVHFRFQKDNAVLAESSFDIKVAHDESPHTKQDLKTIYMTVATIAIAIAIIGFSLKRKRKVRG